MQDSMLISSSVIYVVAMATCADRQMIAVF